MARAEFEDLLNTSQLTGLARRLKVLASSSYVRAEDGFYDVAARPKFKQGQLSNKLSQLVQSIDASFPKMNPVIDNSLKAAGFNGFARLAFGQDADVIKAVHSNGHAYAIRLQRNRSVDERIISPLVVQAYESYADDDYAIQVMPMVQILSHVDSDVPREQNDRVLTKPDGIKVQTTMKYMAQFAFNYCTPSVMKDMAILPDGTPIQVDPGQITYLGDNMGRMHDVIKVGLKSLFATTGKLTSLPEQFRWFAEDGTWKQDRFFVNPFKTTPQYRGFTPGT